MILTSTNRADSRCVRPWGSDNDRTRHMETIVKRAGIDLERLDREWFRGGHRSPSPARSQGR
jgi:hypothetical protein